jgi:hypothetical protein
MPWCLPALAHAAGPRAALHATVALAPRDAHAQAVTTPGSPDYRPYLTVAQFARRFGPGTAEIDKVRAALAREGLRPGRVSANRLAFDVTGAAGVASGALSSLPPHVSGRPAPPGALRHRRLWCEAPSRVWRRR